jgi:hypothetical protein
MHASILLYTFLERCHSFRKISSLFRESFREKWQKISGKGVNCLENCDKFSRNFFLFGHELSRKRKLDFVTNESENFRPNLLGAEAGEH